MNDEQADALPLGAFSISLAVKDLQASRAFYEKLGFQCFADTSEHHYLMMKNGDHVIGLFQGMFEHNILTFNPGWNQDAQPLEEFLDVREIQQKLRARGLSFEEEADETGTGPAHLVLLDPDGNPILIDQHR
jgi:catechol 2,3-dioxygenase-like lactoylglutathione lyase family enzyme